MLADEDLRAGSNLTRQTERPSSMPATTQIFYTMRLNAPQWNTDVYPNKIHIPEYYSYSYPLRSAAASLNSMLITSISCIGFNYAIGFVWR